MLTIKWLYIKMIIVIHIHIIYNIVYPSGLKPNETVLPCSQRDRPRNTRLYFILCNLVSWDSAGKLKVVSLIEP